MSKKALTYETFMPLLRAAQEAVEAEHGRHWRLVPGTSLWATFPAKWVNCKVFGGTLKGRRDHRIPEERFWQDGLPAGAVYGADYVWHSDMQEAA